ncbi:MAG: hypothetical protein MJ185_02690 [Treponema sp.]|nr:hypothetical protein [Treponema sp.]
MDIYAVIHNLRGDHLEHFTEEKWNVMKSKIAPHKIIYVTPDLLDEKLLSFKFEEIIWDRIFNPFTNSYAKIIVPFMPTGYYEMTIYAREKIASKIALYNEKQADDAKYRKKSLEELEQEEKEYNEKLLIHIAETQKIDKDYEDLTTDEEVIKRWMDNGMASPPHKVIAIKNRTEFSWKQFKEFCTAIYGKK